MLSGHQQIEISCSSEPPKPPKIDFRFENCEYRLQIEAGNFYVGAGSDVSCQVKYQNRLKKQGKRQIFRTTSYPVLFFCYRKESLWLSSKIILLIEYLLF